MTPPSAKRDHDTRRDEGATRARNDRTRVLSMIGAPSSAGAYGPGQEHAPVAFRKHGLERALTASGRRIVDRGDGPLVGWQPDRFAPTTANAGLVASVARTLAESVAAAFADGHDVLVLGGDCTVELGTVTGAIQDGARVGLAYVDLDADLNTPETGDGILDWMGVAHILDVAGGHRDLSSLAGRRPMLEPHAVRLFATDNITAAEQSTIARLDLRVESLATVTGDGSAVAERTRVWAAGFDRILVHVDIDVLDFEKFPIAENTDVRGGLEIGQLTSLLTMLCCLPNWTALTLCEVNPAHAPDEAEALQRLIEMLAQALGETRADR